MLTSPHWNLVKNGKGGPAKPSGAPVPAHLEVRGLTIHGVAEGLELN